MVGRASPSIKHNNFMITVCYACELSSSSSPPFGSVFEMPKNMGLSQSIIKSWEACRNTFECVCGGLKIWVRVINRHEILHMFGDQSTVTSVNFDEGTQLAEARCLDACFF
jgi:hypothetical protein